MPRRPKRTYPIDREHVADVYEPRNPVERLIGGEVKVRRRVDVDAYDREREGHPEHVRDYSRTQEVLDVGAPSMYALRRRVTHMDIQAVQRAYAGEAGNYYHSDFVSPDDAKPLVRAIGRYNLFDPDEIVEALDHMPPGTTVSVGREYSPVLYFRNPDSMALVTIQNMLATRQAVPGASGPDELDIGNPLDVYRTIPGGLTPERVQRYGVAAEGRSVRAWWD